jgi:aromatic-L-amino-acid decarboxylase
VPLGRRFRTLKLWFTLRAYGLEGLRGRIRSHVAWAAQASDALAAIPGVEIVTPPSLALFTFALGEDAATLGLLERLNASGEVYLTQGRHKGRAVIRVSVGQWDTTREDVMALPRLVRALA